MKLEINLALLSKEFSLTDAAIMALKAEMPDATHARLATTLAVSTKTIQRYDAKQWTPADAVKARLKLQTEQIAEAEAMLVAMKAQQAADIAELTKATKPKAEKPKAAKGKKAEPAPVNAPESAQEAPQATQVEMSDKDTGQKKQAAESRERTIRGIVAGMVKVHPQYTEEMDNIVAILIDEGVWNPNAEGVEPIDLRTDEEKEAA